MTVTPNSLYAKISRNKNIIQRYFDDSDGRYYLRDKLHRNDYVYDKNFCVFKKEGVVGPSSNNLGPDDYFYDENLKKWELMSVATDLNEIEEHHSVIRKLKKGPRGKSDTLEDDWYNILH